MEAIKKPSDFKYASLEEVEAALRKIDHTKRHPKCTGIRLLRYSLDSDFSRSWPQINIDYTESKQIFATICNHKACDLNAEINYGLIALLTNNFLTKRDIHSILPLPFNYYGHPKCSDSKNMPEYVDFSKPATILHYGCPNFTLDTSGDFLHPLHFISEAYCHKHKRVKTIPCPHGGKCERMSTSLFAMINGIYQRKLPIEFASIMYFGFQQRLLEASLNGEDLVKTFLDKTKWIDKSYFVTPEKLFIISEEDEKKYFFGFQSVLGQFSEPHYDSTRLMYDYDFDGLKLEKDHKDSYFPLHLINYNFNCMESNKLFGEIDKPRNGMLKVYFENPRVDKTCNCFIQK